MNALLHLSQIHAKYVATSFQVNKDPNSDGFATFGENSLSNINLFDAVEDGFASHIQRIKELARENVTTNRCYEVLQEFRSACNPDEDSCDEPNSQTFQLSTEQVCSAVNSRTKLDVTATGNLFDFQNYAVPQPYTPGTSTSVPVYLRDELAVVCCKDDDGDVDPEKWEERNNDCPFTSNETGDVFLAYPSAKELCEEEKGRMCTKAELERNCGNGWPGGQLVWSSTESTDDIACPAISSDICSEFVVELDKMYSLFNTYEHNRDNLGPECDDGYELTEAECEEAGKQLNIGQEREFKVGSWGHTPCGCFLWTNQLHYDKGTTCVATDGTGSNKGIVCKTNAYGLFPAGRMCPQGTELSKAECQFAGEELGFLPDERGQLVVDSWPHTPCGCFLWGANQLHFDEGSTCVATSTDPRFVGKNKGLICKGSPNPMRVNPLLPIQSDFTNVQFPVDFDRVLSTNGKELIEGYEYYKHRKVFVTSKTYDGDLREDKTEYELNPGQFSKCPDGLELNFDECVEAGVLLGLGSITGKSSGWDDLPCRCFMWNSRLHWDGGTRCVATSSNNKGVVCKTLDNSGILGADMKCQALANDAGLNGNYKAWISGSTTSSDPLSSPSSRFANFKEDDIPIPFRLVDGTIIADSWDDLLDGSLQHPIDMDENGLTINTFSGDTPIVWTNTRTNGNTYAYNSLTNCRQWSRNSDGLETQIRGYVGNSVQSNSRWTKESNTQPKKCDTKRRLYCFQQTPVSIVY